ncbi:MAG: Asp-tRNA(Asn)/Glu-tRNA(Gln) amidotransferase subunit GatC [Oscillospiraceae bacterium]|nr:Asp-tRNA(Asn)/Glu-tRNA(Gln) amidotransferase subunit GatC [Oscillospiraceae bacterium]
MQIDDALIAYLEDLSYLSLTDGEKLRLRGDLEKILTSMARLGAVPTDGVPERSHPFDHVNAFREDGAKASCDRQLILRNAPGGNSGNNGNSEFFVAPQTVDYDEGAEAGAGGGIGGPAEVGTEPPAPPEVE